MFNFIEAENVEGDAPNSGTDAGVHAYPTGILREGPVTDTMIAVFYCPVAADRGRGKASRTRRFVGDVPRDVPPPIPSAGLRVLDPCPAVHADRLQRVPVPVRQVEGSIRVKYLDVAIFLAIAALFGRCERVLRRYRCGQIVERVDQRWLIVLHLDEDTTANRGGRLEGLFLAVHGVEGEQAILQFEFRDQSLRNRDFVGFVVNVDRRQDDPAVGREDAQDLRRLLVLQGVKAAPQGLTVDREQRQTIRAGAGQPRRMQAERLLHVARVETGQDISDLRVAWRLEHLRREKHAQPAKMRHDELVHLTIGG